MEQHLKIAHLDGDSVKKINAFEADMDVHIMAFEPGFKLAELSSGQLDKVRALENELGVVLLVYTVD